MALQQDNVGSTIQLTVLDGGVAVDLTTATSVSLRFKKPDGNVFDRDGDISSAPDDGLVEYVTVAGDIDQDGVWQLQATVEMGGTYPSDIFYFIVGEVLE
jgi:hypothetical protein